jgi:hypothetical protein
MVIQDRDRHLLTELGTLRVIDREQARIVGGFGSTTRVNARLLALTQSGFLRRFFLGWGASGRKAIYAISRKGAQLVNVPERGPRQRRDASIASDFFVEHQLAVNEVYCELKYRQRRFEDLSLRSWMSFSSSLSAGRDLIPDGYFELKSQNEVIAGFVEVDLGTERRAVWTKKVESYLQLRLSGDFEREFHERTFRVLVMLDGERRLASIRNTIQGLTNKLFWLTTLGSFREHGVVDASWIRPSGQSQRFVEKLI